MRKLLVVLIFATVACTGKYIRPVASGTVKATPDLLKRGQYLVDQVTACGVCHSTREGGDIVHESERTDGYLAGGNLLIDKALGVKLWVPNITSDAKSGLGTWNDDEIMRAIRDGVHKDGHFLVPLMPYTAFRVMSDEDVRAMVAYLRSVPIVEQLRPRPQNEIPFFFKTAVRLGAAAHLPARDVHAPDRKDKLAYGGYLAHIAECIDCHNLGTRAPRGEDDRFMAGSDRPFPEGGKVWSANLTGDVETGLGRYSEAQIKEALQRGRRLDGKKMAPPMNMLIPHASGLTDDDMNALVAWVKALPPVTYVVPPRELDEATKKELGEE